MSRGDRFVADKFRWLDQVSADPELTRIGLHVALAIARWIQRDTGTGWRPQRLLAEDCRLTEQGLRKAIDQLRTRGHLQVSAGRGRGHASSYRLILKSEETPNAGLGFNDTKPQRTLHLSDSKTPTAVRENPNGGIKKTPTAVAPTPCSTPVSTPVRVSTRTKTRSRATRLSEDWTLPEPWAEEALEKGMTAEQLKLSAARFHDFFTSGNGRHVRRVDWLPRWKTWVAEDLQRNKANGKAITGRHSYIADLNASLRDEHDGPTIEGEVRR